MPRGNTSWEEADKAMSANKFAKLTDKPQTFYYEGLGKAKQGRFGLETPLYLVTEDIEQQELSANGNLYRSLRASGVKEFQKFQIFVTKEDVLDKETNTPQYADDGTVKQRNVYHIKTEDKFLTAEQQRSLLSGSGEEVNIDDIPWS